MPRSPTVSFRNVTKRFPSVVALREVSLDVAAGELHAIVGENGAGKSTLVKCLCGIINDYDGTLLVRGQICRFQNTSQAEQSGVSIIHQELNLVEQLSVAANTFLGREKRTRLGWLDDRAMQQAAAELFEQLQCDIDPRRLVGDLRVGDQQLVEIAKALSLDADILVMDEPTSALTDTEAQRLFRIIDRLRGRGVTIIYISHKMDEVLKLADRITVLRDGQLIRTLDRNEATAREITHLMVGREIEETDLGKPRGSAGVVLQVDGLSLPQSGHAQPWRLKDISFYLSRGEIVGVAGLMGAGRTELLECLFGCSSHPPRGRIALEGHDCTFRHPSEAMRAGIALVTEDRKRLGLFANMNLAANVSICTLGDLRRWGTIDTRRERDIAQQSVDDLSIKTDGVAAPITSLSGGNQQKAIIGRWLLIRPKVLLLDDPTRGVDVGAKAELYRLIDRLCRDGLGILITSSELPELLTLCDRIMVLCEGRLTGVLSREEATEQRIMELATERSGVVV